MDNLCYKVVVLLSNSLHHNKLSLHPSTFNSLIPTTLLPAVPLNPYLSPSHGGPPHDHRDPQSSRRIHRRNPQRGARNVHKGPDIPTRRRSRRLHFQQPRLPPRISRHKYNSAISPNMPKSSYSVPSPRQEMDGEPAGWWFFELRATTTSQHPAL